eukprot:430980-Pleurochrysis_carterae.AAC.1
MLAHTLALTASTSTHHLHATAGTRAHSRARAHSVELVVVRGVRLQQLPETAPAKKKRLER